MVIIAHNEDVGLVPVVDEELHDAVLCAGGILVLVDEYVLVLFLVIAKEVLVAFKAFDHPVDHIVEVVAVAGTHHLLELLELVAGGTQLFHLFPLFLDLVQAHVALFKFLGGALADVFVAVGEVVEVLVYFLADIIAGPAFALHEAEEGLEAVDLEIYVAPVALEGVVLAEAVYKLLHQLDAFEVADGVEGGLFKEAEVVLYDVVAEGVEGVDVDLVGVGADELGEAAAHGYYACVCIGEAKDVGGVEVGIAEEDLSYAC